MAIFEYKALTANGKTKSGQIEGDSLRTARQKLKQQGIFPTSLVESTESGKAAAGRGISINFNRRKVNLTQLAVATRQLATLISAGMPLVEALRALGEQIDNPTFRTIMSEICDKVNEGSTFAGALGDFGKVFPKLYINMVASAEASGSLDLVLERLADLLEGQAALRRKLISALTYPALMIVLCVLVVSFLLAVVVPQITPLFKNKGVALPLPTQIIMGLSEFVQSFWWILIILTIAAVFGIKKYYRSARGQKKIDSIQLKMPLFGALVTKVGAARFARNLGSMLSSGIEILTALQIVRNILGNTIMKDAVTDALEGVREGRGLAKELQKSGVFPRMLTHMIAVGERTGQLDKMLIRAAASYESEVDAFVSGLTSILEPLLIVFLAVIVGGILLSVMLPMLEMTALTSG